MLFRSAGAEPDLRSVILVVTMKETAAPTVRRSLSVRGCYVYQVGSGISPVRKRLPTSRRLYSRDRKSVVSGKSVSVSVVQGGSRPIKKSNKTKIDSQ